MVGRDGRMSSWEDGEGEAARWESERVRHLFELQEGRMQLHFLTCEGQQRCSFSILPIYTHEQRQVILFCFSYRLILMHVPPIPLRFLTFNLTMQIIKKKKGGAKVDAVLQITADARLISRRTCGER